MDVNVAGFELLRIDVERGGTRFQEAERGLRALAHDVAELTGEDELALARCAHCLDEQNVAAHRRPGKTGCDAGYARSHSGLALEGRRSENCGDIIDLDFHIVGLARGDSHRRMA